MKFCILNFFLFFTLLYAIDSNSQARTLFNNTARLRTMTERWELDTTVTRTTFVISPYKPIYVLPVRYSSNPNDQPSSGNEGDEYLTNATNFNNIETKFQISFKTKLMQDIFWGHGDIWGAYTQKSHWQLYNNNLSRPFREVDYEPEIILNFPLNFKLAGFRVRMAGVAFNHESNGKSLPFSRSWNRVIFHVGFDRKNWSVYLRPWVRLSDTKDDNPDISQFVGRGDANIIYTINGDVFSLVGSHNLNFASKVRGNINFSWSHPLKGNLRGYLQVGHGYGETLIDYNYRQTTVGIGISLIEWL